MISPSEMAVRMGLEPTPEPVQHPVVFRLSRVVDVSFPGIQGIKHAPLYEWYADESKLDNLSFHDFMFSVAMDQEDISRLQYDRGGVTYVIERYRRRP